MTAKVDPFSRGHFDPTDLFFQSTNRGCEQLVVFALCCNEKRTEMVWPKVQALLTGDDNIRPFLLLTRLVKTGGLEARIRELKLGQYHRLSRSLHHLAGLKGAWMWHHLIGYAGRKTLSLIAIYTDLTVHLAALDRHVLAGLAEAFPDHNVPARTPKSKAEYDRLEHLFVDLCRNKGMTCWELDREFWQKGKAKGNGNGRTG